MADRAVVFAVHNDDGELQAVQRVFLTSAATNVRRPDGTKKKLTCGSLDGAVVRLPGKHWLGSAAAARRGAGNRTDRLAGTAG
jgi:hypothetical protein